MTLLPMDFFWRIKRRLSTGVGATLGAWHITILVSRANDVAAQRNSVLVALDVQQALYLRSRFSLLAEFDLPINENTAAEVLEFYYSVLRISNAESREVSIRNSLIDMQRATSDDSLRQRIAIEIAKSNFRNGVVDRCKVLLGTTLGASLEVALAASDAAYGAKLATGSWPDASRGKALRYFFKSHEHLLRGKRVLHVSPEEELRTWIRSICATASIKYVTSDIVGSDVDTNQDLTAIALGDNQFDVIICHRVLEHVLDDATAMSELFRVLAPGGFMNVSVPQSMQVAETCDWIIPDETHHGHVRQYGADFAGRLSCAGFTVVEERWLLNQTEARLKANDSFPLRMYLAYKPNMGDSGSGATPQLGQI